MNQDERVVLASKVVELSENQSYIDLVDRVCFYDAPNLNGVMLPSEGAIDKAQTLVNMPVVAKYRQDAQGNPDLGSHEMYVDPATGQVKFGTESVGTHMAVEIKDDVVEIGGEKRTLPCLFATYRIWNRNKNVVNAVKRLYAEGKLGNSWEILSTAFTFADGVKTLTDYVFDGRALLGSGVTPAYGANACSLSMASVNECELVIAEALAQDLCTGKEEPMKNPNIEPEVEKAQVDAGPAEKARVEVNSAEKATIAIAEEAVESEADLEVSAEEPEAGQETEVAMLTVRDLRVKITEAYRQKYPRAWGYIAFFFPNERIAWFEDEGRDSELDYQMITYTVENDAVTISDATPVKLTVSVAQLNDVLAERDSALVSANDTINQLNEQVAELTPYKEAADAAERERVEAEAEENRKEFKQRMLDSKLFTQAEIDTSEQLKSMIENLDETALKMEIAERFMKQMTTKTETVEQVVAERTNLTEDDKTDNAAFMRVLLGR
jgi:hypothetical protein|nr:MAG TPA: hypothetical protein [Caudoviricetes sp.]